MTRNSPDQLVSQYTGLITSWLFKMIRHELATSIDIEQLASTILFDLICYLRKTGGESLKQSELVRICRTITKRRVADEIRSARRRIRLLQAHKDASQNLDEHNDRCHRSPPEQQVELEDFIAVLFTALDTNHRELVEFKRQGWSNREIASEQHPTPNTQHPSPEHVALLKLRSIF